MAEEDFKRVKQKEVTTVNGLGTVVVTASLALVLALRLDGCSRLSPEAAGGSFQAARGREQGN